MSWTMQSSLALNWSNFMIVRNQIVNASMEINWKDIVKFKWFKRLYVLYIFGFIVNFRPSAPFVYEYFLTNKNFSNSDVDENIIPISFYSHAVSLVPVFLFVDFFKYNPLIILSSLVGIVTTCLNIWTFSLPELQVAQAFYGCMEATEIAYYISIYAHVDVKDYQRITSYVRAAPLGGKMVSTLFGQLLISQEWMEYQQLYYFDLSAFILGVILCMFLPSTTQKEKSEQISPKLSSLFKNFIHSFPNKFVVKWSIWSILTISIHHQASIYVQPLWRFLQTSKETETYNGSLEGVYFFFALLGTIFGGMAIFDWKFNGDLILVMTSLVEAFMLIFVSQIDNILLNCNFYVIMGFVFNFILTILCAETAKFLPTGCFGLLFGFVALMASILSAGMVCLLNDKVGIHMEVQDLFLVYGFCDLGVSVLFIIVGLVYWFAKHTYPV